MDNEDFLKVLANAIPILDMIKKEYLHNYLAIREMYTMCECVCVVITVAVIRFCDVDFQNQTKWKRIIVEIVFVEKVPITNQSFEWKNVNKNTSI